MTRGDIAFIGDGKRACCYQYRPRRVSLLGRRAASERIYIMMSRREAGFSRVDI